MKPPALQLAARKNPDVHPFYRWLKESYASDDLLELAEQLEDPEAVWYACTRGDSLIEWSAMVIRDRRLVVRTALACIDLAWDAASNDLVAGLAPQQASILTDLYATLQMWTYQNAGPQMLESLQRRAGDQALARPAGTFRSILTGLANYARVGGREHLEMALLDMGQLARSLPLTRAQWTAESYLYECAHIIRNIIPYEEVAKNTPGAGGGAR